MGSLKKYAKSSDIMVINVTFGHEQFSFNLYKELVIDENKINQEIMEQPTSYAFLTLLSKKLLRVLKDKEVQKDKKYSEVYNRYKDKINPQTNRPYDKDYTNHIANANPHYIKTLKDYLKAKADYEDVHAAVSSFEQRSYLIQTLSANVRKEF